LVVGVALIHGPFVDEVLAYIARDGRFRSCSTNDDEGLDMKLDMKFDLAVVPDAHSLAVDRTVNAPPVTRAVLSNKSLSQRMSAFAPLRK